MPLPKTRRSASNLVKLPSETAKSRDPSNAKSERRTSLPVQVKNNTPKLPRQPPYSITTRHPHSLSSDESNPVQSGEQVTISESDPTIINNNYDTTPYFDNNMQLIYLPPPLRRENEILEIIATLREDMIQLLPEATSISTDDFLRGWIHHSPEKINDLFPVRTERHGDGEEVYCMNVEVWACLNEAFHNMDTVLAKVYELTYGEIVQFYPDVPTPSFKIDKSDRLLHLNEGTSQRAAHLYLVGFNGRICHAYARLHRELQLNRGE